MKRELKNWALAVWSVFWIGALAGIVAPAHAQNPTCPTRPIGDNSNACASTAFVRQATQLVTPSGTFSNFSNDDAPAVQAALNAAGPGGMVLLTPLAPYWINTTLTIPQGVAIGCVAPPQKFHSGSYVSDGCALYLAPNKPITNNGVIVNARIYQDNIHFAGVPASQHALKTITLGYSSTGTGIINNAANAIIQDVAITGFNLCIDENSAYQGSLRHVLGECANGIKYEAIADYLKGLDIELWPFYSAAFTQTPIRCAISNVANNGSGAWRVTTSSCSPSEALQTGDEIYIGGAGAITVPQGALGKHSITVIDSTHFDLTGSRVAPTVSGTTTTGAAYVTGLASLADLWPGETFTGTCFTGTRTLKKLLPGASALVTDANATSSGSCTLTFGSQAFASTGTPQATFDPSGGQHGVGIEFNASYGVIASNVYVWGHDVGLQFDAGASGHMIDGVSIDADPNSYRSERIGILFNSGAIQNRISGNSQTSGGTFLINQNANSSSTLADVVQAGRLGAWVWGAIENDTGSLIVSATIDPDNVGASGQFNGDIFNVSGQNLILANGSRFSNANFYSDTGATGGLSIDSSSNIQAQTLRCDTNACIVSGGLTAGTGGFVVGQTGSVASSLPSDPGGYNALIAGATKGARVVTTSTITNIQGVDNTGLGSFQPLAIGGSTLSLQTNGATNAITINASQVINLPAVATGTPVAALCIDASNNIVKKVGTSC